MTARRFRSKDRQDRDRQDRDSRIERQQDIERQIDRQT